MASFAYKSINNVFPSDIELDFAHQIIPSGRRKGGLPIPRFKLELFRQTVRYQVPNIWNNIPAEVRESPPMETFHSSLKQFIAQKSLSEIRKIIEAKA